MAISFVSFSSASGSNFPAGPNTLSIPIPSGVVEGHQLIAAIVHSDNEGDVSLGGWTSVVKTTTSAPDGNLDSNLTILRHTAGSSEPATYNFSIPNNTDLIVGGILAYSGVDNNAPVDTYAAKNSGSAFSPGITSPIPLESVTRNYSNEVVLAIVAPVRYQNATLLMVSPPTSHTERLERRANYTPSHAMTLEVSDFLYFDTGSTGTANAVVSEPCNYSSVRLALRPDISLPPPPPEPPPPATIPLELVGSVGI